MDISEISKNIRAIKFKDLPNSIGVPGRGSKNPKYLFIGEAPGQNENAECKVFCGMSGQLLQRWINFWGLDKSVYAITNIMKCWPVDSDMKIRKPTDEEIAFCSKYLVEEIKALKPEKLVALGSVSAKELASLDHSIMKNAGRIVSSKEIYGSLPVLIIPHPSYYLRRGIEIDDIIEGAKSFFDTTISIQKPKNKRKIVLDIETNAETDVEKAQIRMIGIYDLDKNISILSTSPDDLQKYMEENKITHVVGYNHVKFDEPILSRFGVDFSNVCNVDLYLTVQNKKTSLGLEKLSSNSLAAVLDALKLGKKLDFDYNILKKEKMTQEEEMKLQEYLTGDIEGTAKLYKHVYNIYSVVERYIEEADAFSEGYLMLTEGRLAYKTICKAKGIREKVSESRDDKPEVIGGFVSKPLDIVNRGKIYLIDVQSSYPHAMMMGNLHERIKENDSATGRVWQRNELFPDLKGTYRAEEMGPVAKLIKEMYQMRKKLKEEKNPGNHGLKILLNTYYGVLASDKFDGVSDTIAGGDVTYMGQTFVKYMRKRLEEYRFQIIYSDTDSVYFKDVLDQHLDKIKKIIRDITLEIKIYVAFPQDTFGFALEDEIIYLEFFPNEETGTFGKKNYLYVTKDKKLIIKGLPIIKRNSTEVAKRVLEKLKQEIVDRENCRFPASRIQEEIIGFLEKDITLCSKTFAVKDFSFYKKPGQIEAQIAYQYGKGVHHLVPNTKIGIGKGKKFCTFDEAKKLSIRDLDLEIVWSNLSPFSEGEPGKINIQQKGLFEWVE